VCRVATERLVVILGEAGLETIPREVWGHPSVYRYARKRGKPPYRLLLDAAYHHQALRRLPGREYRGRPDIVHLTLLALLDSPLCVSGGCEVVVATVADKAIRVKPETRLPRNYLRFTGLMEQLLAEGQVPPGSQDPLLALEDTSLNHILATYRPLIVAAGDEGSTVSLDELARRTLERGAVLVPTTPKTTPTRRLLEAAASLGLEVATPRGLEGAEPWTIVSRLLCRIEELRGIL